MFRLVLLLLGFTQPAMAAEPSSWTVDELVLLLGDSRPVLAARARADAATARVDPAGAPEDPMLEARAEAMGLLPPGEASVVVVEVVQPISGPGKREARRHAAGAEAKAMGTEAAVRHAEGVLELRLLFAQIHTIDAERRALEATGALLSSMSASITARAALPGGSPADVFALHAERADLLVRASALQAEREGAAARLNRLLSRPASAPVPDLPPLPVPPDPTDEESAPTGAVLAQAMATVAAMEARVQAAKAEEAPDGLVGGGLGIDGMAKPVFMLRFGVTLPVFRSSRERALTVGARAEARAARLDEEDLRAQVEAEIHGLRAELQQGTVALAARDQEILPALRSVLDTRLARWSRGEGSLQEVLVAAVALLDGQVLRIRADAERYSAWARLFTLTHPEIER